MKRLLSALFFKVILHLCRRAVCTKFLPTSHTFRLKGQVSGNLTFYDPFASRPEIKRFKADQREKFTAVIKGNLRAADGKDKSIAVTPMRTDSRGWSDSLSLHLGASRAALQLRCLSNGCSRKWKSRRRAFQKRNMHVHHPAIGSKLCGYVNEQWKVKGLHILI